ncbi:MAG: GNAT family N-acetyltransferase [Pseudomonadota bacterium]
MSFRRWRIEDLPSLAAVLGDPDVMRFSDHGPLSQQEQKAWLAARVNDASKPNPLGSYAITDISTDTVLGYVSLNDDPNRIAPGEAEIGFRLAKAFWGNGFATEATIAMVEAANDFEDIHRIIAIVDPNNLTSARVLQKLGMQFEREIMFDCYDYPDHLYAISLSKMS